MATYQAPALKDLSVAEQLARAEDRLKTVVKHVPTALIVIDDHRRIICWNRAAEVVSGGISQEEAIGKDAVELLPFFEETLDTLLANARQNPNHYQRRIPSEVEGAVGIFEIRTFVTGTDVGLLFEVTGTLPPEGSKLQKVQARIEESQLFTELFDELGEAVLISDSRGLIVRANKAAEKILGIPAERLLTLTHDDPIWQAIMEDGTPVPISELPATKALRTKQPITNVELGVVRPDGMLTWILESAAPILDEFGDVTGVIVTFPEVTATVKSRQTLRDLNEKYQLERDRANEANRLKSAFLANMSHEIRTPMTAILGFSDVLASELSGKVSEQHYTFLRSINVSGKRLLNLINDILDLSKIESGRIEMAVDELDVGMEIESAITPLSWIAKQKSLTVIIEENKDKLIIEGDRHRFGQVLTNIISNAIKFTRSGSISVRSFVDSDRTGSGTDHVVVEVEDTGIGISKDFLPHLFEEFRQEHSGQTKEFGGTGLGLAISRRLVSLMGGTIQVRSQQGVGTVFSLVFPLVAQGRKPKAPEVSSTVIAAVQTPPKVVAPSTDGALVLVVEDNAETQRLIEAYLRGHYRIAQAINAQSLYAALKKECPDIIIMDINLPGRDGLTLTKEIRAGSLCPNVPIVALTAFAMTGDRQKCLDAGCNDYLSKPATRREVLDVVARVLAGATKKVQAG